VNSLLGALLALALVLLPLPGAAGLYQPPDALAGPVDWHELPATAEGRQWWDAGSLRMNRQGNLTVLSRFQPADELSDGAETAAEPVAKRTDRSTARSPEASAASGTAGVAAAQATRKRPTVSSLYVMEIDCGQTLFRDTSINGIPQWGSRWQPAAGDGLIDATIKAVCTAGADLLAGS
jgi:hypothetical protein